MAAGNGKPETKEENGKVDSLDSVVLLVEATAETTNVQGVTSTACSHNGVSVPYTPLYSRIMYHTVSEQSALADRFYFTKWSTVAQIAPHSQRKILT